jgi:UDP-N-acetylmuramoyl-L-alanyl-D-glutamate--2,6-diaminopimelate ligase
MLKDLLHTIQVLSVIGDSQVEVRRLQTDSRKINQGDAFIAIKGVQSDGHQFIQSAIQNGAASVICESLPESIQDGVTYVCVKDSTEALGIMCQSYFDRPSSKMKVVGVTGTNGKTTVATLLWKLFSELGYTCGLISTVENRIGYEVIASTHTTPDPISLNALLDQMYRQQCTHVFMECSSHAIHQHRIDGIEFKAAIFTNISHDHLDYHRTFDEYIKVKKSWFDGLPETTVALSNADDKRGKVMLQETAARKYYYSLKTLADFKGKILENELTGLHMIINDLDVHFKLIGEFNAYNLLAVYGAAVLMGEDKMRVLEALSNLSGAEGRFDYITSPTEKVVGIVDYAHTPDALLNVLATLKNLRKRDSRIITVVGCGGNRDKAKRPVMAEVALNYSDQVILTSDNPRFENPLDILQDMEEGVTVVNKKKCITIADRKEAIKTAVRLSQKDDVILLAGKGHEKYQEIAGVKYDFDDKQVLSEMFELMDK